MTSGKTIAVIGANGRAAREVAKAFRDAGWSVRAITRKGDITLSGVENVRGDAFDAASLTAATRGCDFVFHGVNPLYTQWRETVLPMMASTIAAARANGATILLPGNVYNYGKTLPRRLGDETPFAGDHEKAQLRIAMERMLEEASAEGVRSIVLRAGDYFGGEGRGSWFDLAVTSKLAAGKLVWPAQGGIVHAWAYLPDFARAFVAVAERARNLPAFSVFCFEGHNVTMEQLHAAIEKAAGRRLSRSMFPWWLLRLASPFAPMMRELVIMSYLWRRPHALTGGGLEAVTGALPRTPLEQAAGEALAQLGLAPAAPSPGRGVMMRTLAA